MQKCKQILMRGFRGVANLLPILAFVVPMSILYALYPYSFEQTYHGRTLYLFFIWLVFLEAVLSWERLREKKISKLRSIRTILLVAALVLPTVYVIIANYQGLNVAIADFVRPSIPQDDPLRNQHASLIALSAEYLVFTGLFCMIVFLEYGAKGLAEFPLSAAFLGAIGILFTIDNLYPYGRFTPFQVLVPSTATLASRVLNLMGYETVYSTISSSLYGSMPYLMVKNYPWASFGIAWPCSGVESLLIYTVTILLFLRRTDVPVWQRAIYFAVGAVVTYLINILRIVTLFMIAIQKGPTFRITDYDFQRFHNFYGMLYSITWIMLYPLIIIGSRALWEKIKDRRARGKGGRNLSEPDEHSG
jgi:thaumarchaeosortase